MGDVDGFDEIVAALYGVPPGEFVSARDARVREARAAGQGELARAVSRLRRPTRSAWLVNQLSRRLHDTVEELLGIGEDLRAAAVAGSGDRMRELSASRQRLMSVLLREVRRLGESAGVQVSVDALREVESSLAAAMVDPEVATSVRRGVLAAPVEYAGFGPAPSAPRDSRVARPERRPARSASRGGVGERAPRAPAHTTRERAARERAERARVAAQRAVEEAERSLAEQEAAWRAAADERDEARAELDRLREMVRETERRLATLERAVRQADRQRERAADALVAARRRATALEKES